MELPKNNFILPDRHIFMRKYTFKFPDLITWKILIPSYSMKICAKWRRWEVGKVSVKIYSFLYSDISAIDACFNVRLPFHATESSVQLPITCYLKTLQKGRQTV